MTIYETLASIGFPCVYSASKQKLKPPYLAYRGNGQDIFFADDTYYHTQNGYVVEYYFTEKNEETEAEIEETLLANGFRYEKSEDISLDDEGVWLIYYYV